MNSIIGLGVRGWRVFIIGSNANNSANTGAFYINANNDATNANVNISSHLALNSKVSRTSKPCLLAKQITKSHRCW